ncbi:MAG: YicC family protein [Oscillospiraceae bacterium]|nr:YicC family protein [Oscillospiraceae bacterium]
MLRSMTGFGREHIMFEGREILVEIKSVNSRYYEFSSKLPRAYGYIDEKLKSLLANKISRGKVEVSVSIFNQVGTDAEIEVNEPLARQYVEALRGVSETLNLRDDLSLTSIMRFSDVFTVKKTIEDEETVWEQVKQVAQAALDKFITMRETEGAKMHDDIASRLQFIEDTVAKIEAQSPETTKAYREKLFAKIKAVVEDRSIDDARVLTEAAIFSEKTAVDEETVRLRSHLSQYRSLIEQDIPVGRKLDFLTQELNREVNTIGSKCQDLEITRMVVDLKSEIEKIREQIQNIE